MRWLTSVLVFTIAACAQPLPQAVDLVERVDNLYPWLNVVAFDVDAQGNTYLAGSPLGPIPGVVSMRTGPLGGADIVVIKVGPAGQLVYGAAIGGTADEFVGRIKVDSAQSLYLFGTTNSADYPALSSQGGGNALILKLDATGSVIFNTRLSWAEAIITMNLGPAGTTYIGGQPKPGELPTKPGAYRLSSAGSAGFVARIDLTGTQVEAATYVDEAVTNLMVRASGDVLFSMGKTIAALDSSLSRLLFSTRTDVDNSIATVGVDGSGDIYVAVANAVRKFAPDGQRVLWAHDFASATFSQFAVTPSGTAFLTGSVPFDYPTFHGTQSCAGNLQESASGVANPTNGLLMAIGPDGDIEYATFMAEEIPAYLPITVSSADGRPYAFGQAFLVLNGLLQRWRGILSFDADNLPAEHASAECLLNLATMQPSRIAPGTIMTLLGEQMGPSTGGSFALQDGRVPFSVAGTSVTVDGVPAAVLYAQGGQINFVAPWSVRTDGLKVRICVATSNASSCLYAATAANAPGLLQLNSQIAAIDPDETVNSIQHPAPGGTYVSVYMTGAGQIEGPLVDGGVAGFDLQRITGSTTATFTFTECAFFGCRDETIDTPVLFAGAVPTLVYGVEVVIVKVPTSFALPTLVKLTLSFRATPQSAPAIASGYLYVG